MLEKFRFLLKNVDSCVIILYTNYYDIKIEVDTMKTYGAKASAVLYSIAATALANGVDTEQYLTKLFSQPVGTIILPLNT